MMEKEKLLHDLDKLLLDDKIQAEPELYQLFLAGRQDLAAAQKRRDLEMAQAELSQRLSYYLVTQVPSTTKCYCLYLSARRSATQVAGNAPNTANACPIFTRNEEMRCTMVDMILSHFFNIKSERLNRLFTFIMPWADDGKLADVTAVTITAMIVLGFLTYYLWALICLFVGCTYILVISLFKWYFTLRESYRAKKENG